MSEHRGWKILHARRLQLGDVGERKAQIGEKHLQTGETALRQVPERHPVQRLRNVHDEVAHTQLAPLPVVERHVARQVELTLIDPRVEIVLGLGRLVRRELDACVRHCTTSERRLTQEGNLKAVLKLVAAKQTPQSVARARHSHRRHWQRVPLLSSTNTAPPMRRTHASVPELHAQEEFLADPAAVSQ